MKSYQVKINKRGKYCCWNYTHTERHILFLAYDGLKEGDTSNDTKTNSLKDIINLCESGFNGALSTMRDNQEPEQLFNEIGIEKLKRLQQSKNNTKGFVFEFKENRNDIGVESMGKLD